MPTLKLTVNGRPVSREVPGQLLLVQLLREELSLTGTHVGCDTTQCGACTVHLNGRPIKSCTTLAMSCEGGEVTTIEGIADGANLHPMQEAFRANHGLQCGYCTPGFVMASIKIVERLGPDFTDEEIREELEGNICRCTGYHNIVKSVRAGARAMAAHGGSAPVRREGEERVVDSTRSMLEQISELDPESNEAHDAASGKAK
ncbi:2Fe-2S iron-sulfur cluster-binding protein [Croceicoccus sp. BE223]|uniref:(2Fe-2S)-binding protein n=1 Tax=Croceicoccus sp. BE223 TaxID=2817716 RepID=UPI0028573EFB|nr:2Fe-2S iron-sulfur cluster-binding protein [Croceicoccus sp. BE223]MDR7103653.1 carbon-monoxide dehydrogenase small subunit [Croceicoccus sp. BE223]